MPIATADTLNHYFLSAQIFTYECLCAYTPVSLLSNSQWPNYLWSIIAQDVGHFTCSQWQPELQLKVSFELECTGNWNLILIYHTVESNNGTIKGFVCTERLRLLQPHRINDEVTCYEMNKYICNSFWSKITWSCSDFQLLFCCVMLFLPPPTKLREGNIFTGVYQSF